MENEANKKDVAREKLAEERWELDYIDILRWRLGFPKLDPMLRPGTACSEPYGWFGSDGKIHTLSDRAKDRIQRRVMKRVNQALALLKEERKSWGEMKEAEKTAADKPSIMDINRLFG